MDKGASLPGVSQCNVCQQREAVGVACSALGPVSWAYCAECLTNRAEPACMIAATIDSVGGADGLAEWVYDINTWVNGGYVSFRKAAESHAPTPSPEINHG